MAEELVKRGELLSDGTMLKILTNKLDTLHNQVRLYQPHRVTVKHNSTQHHSRGSLMVSRGHLDRERC